MSIKLEETIDTLLTGKNPFDQPEGPVAHPGVGCDGCEQ